MKSSQIVIKNKTAMLTLKKINRSILDNAEPVTNL